MKERNTWVIVFNQAVVRSEDLDHVPPDFEGDIVVNGHLMLEKNIKLKARLFVSGDINACGVLELAYVECQNLKCSELRAEDIYCNGHFYCRNIVVSGDIFCSDAIFGRPRISVLGNITCKSIEYASTIKVTGNLNTTNGGIKTEKLIAQSDVNCNGDLDAKYLSVLGNLKCNNFNSTDSQIHGTLKCINVCCNTLSVYGALCCADISAKMLMIGSTIKCYNCIVGCITSVD